MNLDKQKILAIDTVVNPHTPEIVKMRPDWSGNFHNKKFGRDNTVLTGYSYEEMLRQMDAAGIERRITLHPLAIKHSSGDGRCR